MPWPCYIVEMVKQDPPFVDWRRPGISHGVLFRTPAGDLLPFNKLRVGAIYRDPELGIVVKLPGYHGNNRWPMEQPGYPTKNLWQIIGEFPRVTANPSVNCVGAYHGWVQNGVVTEDCDGRKFDDRGILIS